MHFSERDDGGGEVVERHEAAFELCVAYQQFAEPIEPAMADLDHPVPGLLAGMALLGLVFLPAAYHVGNVVVALDDL